MNEKHAGSCFDGLLAEEGKQEMVASTAIKPSIAREIGQAMKMQKLGKTAPAAGMRTRRMAFNRLFNANDTPLKLTRLTKLAMLKNTATLGKLPATELTA